MTTFTEITFQIRNPSPENIYSLGPNRYSMEFISELEDILVLHAGNVAKRAFLHASRTNCATQMATSKYGNGGIGKTNSANLKERQRRISVEI